MTKHIFGWMPYRYDFISSGTVDWSKLDDEQRAEITESLSGTLRAISDSIRTTGYVDQTIRDHTRQLLRELGSPEADDPLAGDNTIAISTSFRDNAPLSAKLLYVGGRLFYGAAMALEKVLLWCARKVFQAGYDVNAHCEYWGDGILEKREND